MSSAIEIAASTLPHFQENVLRGSPRSYGYYARAIGRDPAKESMVIGMAMHVIGAACIFARIPVAPLFYLERAGEDWRGIFESEYAEKTHVKPHWDVLLVSSRVYRYKPKDFDVLKKAIEEVLPQVFTKAGQSPRALWRYIIYRESPSGGTWLNRALAEYEKVIEQVRSQRNAL